MDFHAIRVIQKICRRRESLSLWCYSETGTQVSNGSKNQHHHTIMRKHPGFVRWMDQAHNLPCRGRGSYHCGGESGVEDSQVSNSSKSKHKTVRIGGFTAVSLCNLTYDITPVIHRCRFSVTQKRAERLQPCRGENKNEQKYVSENVRELVEERRMGAREVCLRRPLCVIGR